MPSSSYLLLPRGLSVFQIQKFIPKKWKQTTSVSLSETQNKYNYPTSTTTSSSSSSISSSSHKEEILLKLLEETTIVDSIMVDSILTTLKEFTAQPHLSKAFRTFSLIQSHHHSSTTITSNHHIILHSLSSLLLCCTNLKSFPQGQQIHAQSISLGLEQHSVMVPKLVSFYSAFNLFVDAHFITENSNIFHPLPWNLLLSSYVRNGFFVKALSAYTQLVSKGIRPDNFTYPSVLKACGEEQNLGFGREVHKSIDASSHEWSLFVHNALVSMYSRCGEVEIARELFDKMPERDAVSWNSMISGYASKGIWARAFELFESMRVEGIEVNIITWNTIAGGCLRTGNSKGALELLSQMRTCGIHLDSVATIIGLGACSHNGMLKLGKEIHGVAIRKFWDGYDNVRNALVTMYSRCRDLRHAYILFRLRENRSVITWNSIISGFTYWDQSEEALFLFREMLLSGVEPNFVTIASILPLCARVPNLQHGKEFHCYITRREGFKDYLLLWNSLVAMYARSGEILDAKRLFDLLSKKDEVTYTSLIAGYGAQGKGQAALKLFYEMIRFGIKPDHITMVAVLSACSHSGLVSQGQMIFEKMPSVYGITPGLEHFACMIDLFGRAGLLKKAEEIIKKMPYPPSPAMWATLIGACRIHGNTEIGEWAAEKLLEMRPEHSGYYVLIANMYAAAGCWNKLAKVRTFMRDLGVRKAPGCAWVDAGTGFSPFSVADTSNSKADEIYLLLGCLTKQMKEAGYVATEDFEVEEEDFEESLSVGI